MAKKATEKPLEMAGLLFQFGAKVASLDIWCAAAAKIIIPLWLGSPKTMFVANINSIYSALYFLYLTLENKKKVFFYLLEFVDSRYVCISWFLIVSITKCLIS